MIIEDFFSAMSTLNNWHVLVRRLGDDLRMQQWDVKLFRNGVEKWSSGAHEAELAISLFNKSVLWGSVGIIWDLSTKDWHHKNTYKSKTSAPNSLDYTLGIVAELSDFVFCVEYYTARIKQ